MNAIRLLTEKKYNCKNFKQTGFLDGLQEADAEIPVNLKFEILFQSSIGKEEGDFILAPLNKVKISDSAFQIVSVSKRTSALDRLLIPENFPKKNIPIALRDLPLIVTEDRALLQLKHLLPEKTDIEHRFLEGLSPGQSDIKDKAIILPWYSDRTNWLHSGYTILELHPAEFTPEAGSGCWAILGHGNENEQQKELVRSLHHPASLVFTNTERKLIRDFDLPGYEIVGAHLESIVDDNYHLYICLLEDKSNQLFWIDYPSSTFGEMSTEAINTIKIYLEQKTLV